MDILFVGRKLKLTKMASLVFVLYACLILAMPHVISGSAGELDRPSCDVFCRLFYPGHHYSLWCRYRMCYRWVPGMAWMRRKKGGYEGDGVAYRDVGDFI
ncbi:hypothetical protein BaRGS_00034652 [Batillaria attramentaria]|uniref:Uncharacterized protein n=1 Tax=Batillaria attramentaria TaxID=370345 RepID=A0ABD0JHD0_9CAEN